MAPPLRVGILVRSWTIRGGNGKSAVELCRRLLERGHQVTVLCQKTDGSPALSLPPTALRRVGGLRFDPSLAALSFSLRATRLAELLKARGELDVTIGFDHATRQDVFRLGGGVHAEFLEETRGVRPRPGGRVLDRVELVLERARFRPGHFKALVAVSERVAADVVRHYGVDAGEVQVVRNSVDLRRFGPAAEPGERERVRTRWQVGGDEPVALLVGQNPSLKGVDVAADAAARAGLRLVYVGGRRDQRASYSSAIVWDGVQSDVAACYRSADVLIQPSRYEAFGNAVLEAAACGLVAVAPSWMGASELFAGTELAELLLPNANDVEGLSARLRLALHEEKRARLRALALEIARQATPERWADQMEEVLERAARSPR